MLPAYRAQHRQSTASPVGPTGILQHVLATSEAKPALVKPNLPQSIALGGAACVFTVKLDRHG